MAQQRLTVDSALSTLLSRFQAHAPGILGTAIVDNDGFIIAARLPQGVDEQRIAGIGAALVALGEQVALELQHGNLTRTFVESDQGYVTAISLGTDAVLIALARREAKPGLVFLQLNRTAEEIRRVMNTLQMNNLDRMS